jgi:uncharacterized protein (DUF2147 family)
MPCRTRPPQGAGFRPTFRNLNEFSLHTSNHHRSRLSRWRAALLPLASAAMITTASAAEPYGDWLTADRDSRVRITRCGSNLCGSLAWLSEPNDENSKPKRDIYNPDDSLRGRPVLGMPLLLGLKRDGDRWVGKIYNPENGKTYDAQLRQLSDKSLELQGCVGFIFCEKQVWTRD